MGLVLLVLLTENFDVILSYVWEFYICVVIF